jgi:predicted dehydrogenase
MTDTIRWGILGTGRIAGEFARGLTATPDAQLVAVGSRTQESADRFSDEHHIPRRHATYEALAADPDVDAIYISTPHSLHAENGILCLEHGKAVLCEKPFTINVSQTDALIAKARQKKRFLMEAMWTRFLPVMVRLRQLVAEGAIGEPRMLQADFGYRAGFNPQHRLFDPALGGGGLLDVGVYPISLASMIFGAPEHIVSVAHLGETGVDEQSAALFNYSGGQIAIISSATRTETPQEVTLMGTEGRIYIPPQWWRGTKLVLTRAGKPPETLETPYEGNGYNYEAAEVGRCLREGRLESDIMPLDETRAIMAAMDTVRAQWGLKYPMES